MRKVIFTLVVLFFCSVCMGQDERWARWDAMDAARSSQRADRDMSYFLSQQQTRLQWSPRLRVEVLSFPGMSGAEARRFERSAEARWIERRIQSYGWRLRR